MENIQSGWNNISPSLTRCKAARFGIVSKYLSLLEWIYFDFALFDATHVSYQTPIYIYIF
jgi:hypothetical protein